MSTIAQGFFPLDFPINGKSSKTGCSHRGYGTTALKYPLSGLIFCGECRSACYSVTGSRGRNLPGLNYYFQCKNWRLRACSQKQMVRM
ncbi:MAG: zinc ribbon domain-containing protein [Nostoc sp. EfeVER01]|uniref:zinc ribbon domain-containing protein n=1 Tax=unclassified Nostoc TaxID=2593658 RepID=UPI003918C8A5